MTNDIVVVDIDGTVADGTERSNRYLLKSPKDWDSYFNACGDDTPIVPVIRIVQALSEKYRIVYCTGRRESCREATCRWLSEHVVLRGTNGNPGTILFRGDGDRRHDVYVKPERLADYLNRHPGYRVACILEDRNSMVAKWRELGYTCLQVAEGDF